MATTRKDSARERILEAALELFYERGVQAVGVDAVVERAGVAKMSLYKHFKSKDELVVEFLKERDRRWRAAFVERVEAHAADPKERILAAFDVLAETLGPAGFRGCAFLNTAAELSDPDHPARAICADHVAWLRGYFEALSRGSGARDPAWMGGALVAMFLGATAAGATERSTQTALDARRAAEALLDRA